ncbi:unnamed protein product [Camellia sinensis]
MKSLKAAQVLLGNRVGSGFTFGARMVFMPMMKPLTSLDFNSSVFNSSDTTRATWSRRYWRDSGTEEWQARTSVLQRRGSRRRRWRRGLLPSPHLWGRKFDKRVPFDTNFKRHFTPLGGTQSPKPPLLSTTKKKPNNTRLIQS